MTSFTLQALSTSETALGLQGILNYAWLFLLGALAIIVAFGLAIFIHELGHFLAAKAFGVPVERFVIGFDKEAIPFLPRCIWEKQIGETVYGLSLVPLGGYVKMSGVVHPEIERYLEGEDDKQREAREEQERQDRAEARALTSQQMRPDGVVDAPPPREPRNNTLQGQAMQDMAALYKKPYWQKVIIYSAGVIMNLVLAMAVTALLFAKGFMTDAPLPAKVGWISPDSRFAETELQAGDRVIAVADVSVETTEDLFRALNDLRNPEREEGPAEQVEFTLRRAAEEHTYSVTFDWETITGDQQFSDVFFYLPAYIEMVMPNDPADKAGVRGGDFIVAIDGEEIVDWTHFRYIVQRSPGEELLFTVLRGEQRLDIPVTPIANPDAPDRGLVGVFPGNPEKELTREPVMTAVVQAPGRVINRTRQYVNNLKELGGKAATGNITAVRRELGGPVGIAQLAYRQAQRGMDDWLNFLIILNVALAVMNILPIPVLDGGHIVFATYEVVVRRPVPPKILIPMLNGAVVFILLLFVLITFNDIFKIFI